MSHIPSGRQSAPMDVVNGLVSNSNPADLAEGASPWSQDMDHVIGSVFTRAGLVASYNISESVNFNYFKTYIQSNSSNYYNIALDALGNLWEEDVINAPGTLTKILTGITPGVFANSVTLDEYEYMAFSSPTGAYDIPRQINGNPNTTGWIDRISQCAPGAPPTFQATLGAGEQVVISAISGSGTVLTCTSTNSLTVGEVVTFSAFGGAAAVLNTQVFSVLGTGLSGSQFEVASSYSGATSTGVATPQYGYPILSITQHPSQSLNQQSVLWSSGPGSTTIGSVITFYYAQSSNVAAQDLTLVNAFNSGLGCYVYIKGCQIGNGTWVVTGVGQDTPPGAGAARYYFTVQAQSAQYQDIGAASPGATYQLSLATLTSSVPVPNLSSGQTMTLSGVSPGGWDGTWAITNVLTSGVLDITQTSMTAGTATYTFTVASGVPPAAGELVEIIGCLNGNGIFNVPNSLINSVSLTGAVSVTLYESEGYSAGFGGVTIYDGTITGGDSNSFVNFVFEVTGFSNPDNNGTYTCVQSSDSQLYLNNYNGVVEYATANATQTSSSGTFTIVGFPNENIGPVTEFEAQAQTSGTQFQFDPGQAVVGTTTNPIYGNAGAVGLITIATSENQLGEGTRQGVCFFETRNGLKTQCSYPVTFNTSAGANYLLASNIPVGPANVTNVWIALTGAGPNGIPGPNFYTIDTPVTYTLNNQNYAYSATYVPNGTTQAKFTFTDAILLASDEIDVQGNDLFALKELGNVGWCTAYASRMFYGLEQSKVLNLINMSFDGGYTPTTGNVVPLGWGIDPLSNTNIGTPVTILSFQQINNNQVEFTGSNNFATGQLVVIEGLSVGTQYNGFTLSVDSSTPTEFICAFGGTPGPLTADFGTATPTQAGATLVTSPIFGQAYYIINSLGSTQGQLGMIVQSAFQDWENEPIINTNTAYSVRVTACCPSGSTGGTLAVDLTNYNVGLINGVNATIYGGGYGTFSVPFSSMTTTMQTFTGPLLTSKFTGTVPVGLLLRVYAANITYGSDVMIDRIEVFPTAQPVLTTNVAVSYVDDFEAIDSVTGNIGLASHNSQPCYGAFEMYDTLYFLKESSMESTKDVPGEEPSSWPVHEVSNRVGACGINAYDYGEEWAVMACRNGVYGFNGGQPIRLDFQTKEIWESINWAAGKTIVVRNDITGRRLHVWIPLPTPNQWLPLAPANANPTSPNVDLMINYQGLNTFEALVTGEAEHTTMFGSLVSLDMRQKVSLWQIPTNYAGFIVQPDLLTRSLMVCNSSNSGKIYSFQQSATSDDGAAINSIYTTYGFVNSIKAAQYPLLGFHRKRFNGFQCLVEGTGNMQVKVYPNWILNKNTLLPNPYTWTVPGGINLSTNPSDDIMRPLNVGGNRVFFQYSTNAVGAGFNLSKMIAWGVADPRASVNPNVGSMVPLAPPVVPANPVVFDDVIDGGTFATNPPTNPPYDSGVDGGGF